MNPIVKVIGEDLYLRFIQIFIDYKTKNRRKDLLNFILDNDLETLLEHYYGEPKTLYRGITYRCGEIIETEWLSSWSNQIKIASKFAVLNLIQLRDLESYNMDVFRSKGFAINLNSLAKDMIKYLEMNFRRRNIINFFRWEWDGDGSSENFKLNIIPQLEDNMYLEEDEYLMNFDLTRCNIVEQNYVGGKGYNFKSFFEDMFIKKLYEGTDLPQSVKNHLKCLSIDELHNLMNRIYIYNKTYNTEIVEDKLKEILHISLEAGDYKIKEDCYIAHRKDLLLKTKKSDILFNSNINIAISKGIGLACQSPISKDLKVEVRVGDVKGFALTELYAEIVRLLKGYNEDLFLDDYYYQFIERMDSTFIGTSNNPLIKIGEKDTLTLYERVHRVLRNTGMNISTDEEYSSGRLFEMALTTKPIQQWEINEGNREYNDENILTIQEIQYLNYKIKKIKDTLDLKDLVNKLYEFRYENKGNISSILWNLIDKPFLEPYLYEGPMYRGIVTTPSELNDNLLPVSWSKNLYTAEGFALHVFGKEDIFQRAKVNDENVYGIIMKGNQLGIDLSRLSKDIRLWAEYGDCSKDLSEYILNTVIEDNEEEIISPLTVSTTEFVMKKELKFSEVI